MEIDPQSFFGDLTAYSKDVKRGPYQCQQLLETLNRNLIEEQINSSFIDLYLIHIFEKSNGLISFIEGTIKDKSFQKATSKAVEILYTLVNNFPSRLVEHNILDVYSLCISIIKSNANSDIKGKILELLVVSLEKLDICIETEDVSATYKQLLSSLQNALRQNHCDTVKHKELVALGVFVKRYQYLVTNPKEIQQFFVRSFESESIKPSKKSQNIICGFFTGFSYYCESYPLDSNVDKKLIEGLYKFMKVLVVPTESRIKIGNRAALLFLSNNIRVFGEFLLKEYKFWHINLLKWLDMGPEEKKSGSATLTSFVQVIALVVYEKNEGDWRSVVEYFNQWCKDILRKNGATSYEKRLALQSLKQFSAASYKYLPQNDVTELFLMVMHTFEYSYILNYDPNSEEWEFLPDYVQTVANFMQFKMFTASEFYCLQRAVINMIKSFHQLPYVHYGLVIDGIVTTCFYLKKSQYFDAFIENIIYQGVVWSCSHQHISNAEFAEETSEKIITVKNFFPLWNGILKLTSNRTYDKYGLYLEDRKYILERIVNQLVKTLMILINKLNLSVKLKEEDITLTEPEKAYQVEQADDYAIFLNLIDFYQEILNNIEPRMFRKCICKIIKHIINKCVQYPLISGFYKLLSYSLKIANKLNLFCERGDVNQDIANARETLTKFLEILLAKMIQYKDELLIACLQVLLECPVVIVKDMLAACVIPFVTVFNVGRSYFPLAEMGLDTLEYWQDNMDSNDLDPLLSKVVASLDTYLRSKSLQGQTQANVSEKRRKTVQTLKKRKVLLELEPQLVRLQKRILTFIGKQSSKICQAFVYSDNIDAPAMICGENFHLKVTLPYEDVHLDIYLDTFVPRVVNLALYCSDRRTRITACEVLQATVMILLGRAKPMSHTGLSELEDLLKMIAMPLLQLGCDIDQLVQQIFAPLFLQLIHWYTSPTQIRGSHTAIIIDVLMEGITHPTDSCLRDFSGKCINEFIKWTIKQTNEDILSRDPVNVKVLVKKMRFFSSHPDYAKKLGAALIFNNIYRELREEEAIISIFWLEILHIFVTSLGLIEYNSLEDNNTIIQINNALSHLQRVFVEKPQLFRTRDDRRRVPSDIKGCLLKDVAVWLLQQTGNRSRNCRESCMDLFITIAPLSDKKVNLQGFARDNFTNDFVSNIYEKFILKNPTLADITHTEDCTVLLKWLRGFLCALDGYNFVMKNNLGDVTFVDNVTFGAVDYFLKNLYNVDMPKALNLISHKSWTFTSLDREQFNKLRSACVISILKLLNTIINDEILCKKSDAIWTTDVWKLILNTIFCPHLLGLDNRVSQPKHLELLPVLLNNLPRKLSEQKIFELVEVLHNYIERNCFTSIDLKTNVTLLQRNVIRGLLLLNSTNINKQLKVEKYTTGLVNELMQNFYTTQDNNVIFVNELQETTLEHCVLILKFSLTNPSEFKCLVNHLCQPYLVQSMEFNKEVTFGIYLLNIFEDVIIHFLLKNFGCFLDIAVEKGNLNLTLELVMFVLSYALKNKSCKQHYNDISEHLFEKWTVFKELFNASGDNVHLGIEYLKLLMPICKLQTAEYQLWLVERLLEDDDLNNKLQIFHLLVDTVDDKTVKCRDELENGLSNLSNEIISSITDAVGNTLIFDKMLTVIPHVRSSIILKSLMQLYLNLSTNTEITPLLAKFMRNVDDSLQQSTLRSIYEMSCDEDRAFDEKHKIIRDIMPPLFQKCSISCFEEFYEAHINEIISKLQDGDLGINILGFVLVEILFLRIPIGTPERSNCSISRAANNTKLLPLLLKFALDAFKKFSAESKELLRLYKCYAYNALASIVSNSLKSLSFYEKLFIRQEDNKDILWNGIIDTSTNFDFPILFDSIPSQRKVLISIRDEIRAQQRKDGEKGKSMRYIESQRLFNSSLSEDVTNFDFTNTIIRTEKVDEDQKDISVNCQCEIQLDAINVNSHDCMATVCGVIQHIFNTGVNELPEEGEEAVLPSWMKGMRATLLSQETHKNIKIFLVKVIDNMINIFNHYSNWFLEPLMQFLVDKCAGDEINYFVTDVIIILAKWASKTVQLNERESQLASDMLNFLISSLKYERLDVFKYNLDLLKLIVEAWRNYIKVPAAKIFQLISTEAKCEIGIHLTSIFLVNDLAPWQDNQADAFLNLLIKRMGSTKKSVFRPCAETIGLSLKYLKNERYSENVNTCLKRITESTKYVYCLEGVAVHFPQIVNGYHVAKLIGSLNQYPDPQKILHLKIIHRRAEVSLDILDEISDFKIVEWDQLLENANLEIQIITLEIIKKCLSVFMSYKGYVNIIKTLLRNINNPNVLYRSCIYDIAMLIYQQNKDDLDVCKEILIFGLVDSDESNREKVVRFWTDNSNLPSTVVDRFPYLLSNLYKTKMEDQFLGYVNYFLITVLTKEECDVELFDHPLEDCDFEDYKLQTNWRLQHPSVVPLFADTMQTYNEFLEPLEEDDVFQLKKTQTTFDFAPTQSVHEQEFSKFTSLESSLAVTVSGSANSIKNPNELVMSQKYRLPRKRFLKDKSKISASYAQYEIKKRVKKVQQRIDLAKEREKRVNIYRNYRKGDLPDIQIMLSSVLKPLQMLSLHDSEVSKILFSEIFKGLVSKVEKNDLFLETVSSSIRHIFNNSTYFNSNLFSTLLDILLRNKDKIRFDPQLLTYVCQQSGLVSVGTLLLEEYLISYDDEPSGSKKGSGAEENAETVYWVKLAELYKELEEWDMVRSIFLEKMNCKDLIQTAIKYESESQWQNARELYKELIETDMSAERKDFYYESYFKCFANLGEWEYLPETIKSVVTYAPTDNVWDILWDSGWYQQKLLPWYISAQVKNILFSQTWPEDFSRDINKCLSSAEKAEYLKTYFSEELCMMWLYKKDVATARIYLQSYIKSFLSEWQLLNPMFQSLRYNRVLKLRNFIETDEFIFTYNNISEDFEDPLKKLTGRWQNTSSEMLPSVLLNETRVLYRTLFINLLREKISRYEFIDLTEMENLNQTKFNLDIALIETSTELDNYYISRRYIKKCKNTKHPRLQLAFGNIMFLRSQKKPTLKDEIVDSFKALDIFGGVFDMTQDQSILVPAKIKFFGVATRISKILTDSQELFLEYQQKLSKRFKKQITNPAEIGLYASRELKSAVEGLGDDNMDCDNYEADSKCKDIAKAYVKLAHYTRDQNNDELQGDFILFVLRAMKLNSLEAKQLFPCILMQSRLGTDYSRLFIIETEKIPTWMFLGWIPQLLANVDSQKIFAISKVIIRIAESYPQAIMYPYRLSKENYNFRDNNVAEEARFLIKSLDKLLLSDEMVEKFLKALSYVSVPAGVLRYFIAKIYKSDNEDNIKTIQNSIMEDIFGEAPDSGKVNNMQGNMFKKIARFKKDFAKINPKNKKLKDDLKKVDGELLNVLKNEKTSSLLKDYCPWLANFSANRLHIDMEIPGQYDGQKLPLIQHHVKISGFCPNVLVMSSLRKPIKLTILGMDTKEYPFLVKFGEDIRQDQRIQQLFGLMNDIFKSDANYSCTGLDILTYQVIPLTSSLGILQWIDGTQPLGNFVKKSLKDKKALEKISNEYENWLCKRPEAIHGYGMAAAKYSRDKTINFYRSVVNKIPEDVMKTSFWSLSTNTENYIALRNNFIKSYAVLCASQWILGIGDRHLENSLICIRNGKVLGIDFGHAFGTATQILPVPELVPFRLTPHIVNLMEPLKERGQFRESMIHTLRTLRVNYTSLLATMNVFIEEPSLDWLEHASRFEGMANEESHNWYPNVKVDQARRKLQGASSTKILIEDLIAGQKVAQYTEAYVRLVKGLPQYDKRAQFAEENLSVESQVDCLIDHATDYNLLGRMYVGWRPFV